MANPSLAANTNKFGDLKNASGFDRRLDRLPYRCAHSGPGINPAELAKLFQSSQTGLLDMFNMFSGGPCPGLRCLRYGHHAVHLGFDHPAVGQRSIAQPQAAEKEGDAVGEDHQYTRYATVLLATFQSFGIAAMLFKQPNLVVTCLGST